MEYYNHTGTVHLNSCLLYTSSSTNMSSEEIDKAVKEAEKFAAEDKKRKEEIEIRNQADQLVYQSEKTLNEMGDKVSADEKSSIQAKVDALKEALKGDNIDDIKAKQEELQKLVYDMSAKMYQQAQAQQQAADPNAAAGAANNNTNSAPQDDVVDVDYTEVDDNNNK